MQGKLELQKWENFPLKSALLHQGSDPANSEWKEVSSNKTEYSSLPWDLQKIDGK